MSRQHARFGHRPSPLGFTLIETLVVVMIIAVLAATAIPAYQDSVRQSRRSDAFAALAAVQHAQERWRGHRMTYAASVTAAPTDDPPGLGLPGTSSKGYYSLAVSGASATGYTVMATALPGTSQSHDGPCQRLRVRVTGGNLFHGSAAAEGEFDESDGNRCWAHR
jgi:type IV pilus assembly protein PilE